jgi:Na+/H+-translocating membrane pyrophosphatase
VHELFLIATSAAFIYSCASPSAQAASKGYAVGGSALSCFVLFQAFLDETSAYSGLNFSVVNIAKVEVVCGGLIGSMMIFLFAGWAMQSVGTTAQKVVWEVRRQFKNKRTDTEAQCNSVWALGGRAAAKNGGTALDWISDGAGVC